MARLQQPQNFTVAVNTTATPLTASEHNVTSFIIQAPVSNTDFIKVGNSSLQVFQIAPGRDLEVNGDNLDLGTSGYVNLNEWFVSSVSGTQSANILYLERF